MRLTFRELQMVLRPVDDYGWTLTDRAWEIEGDEEIRKLDQLQAIQQSTEAKIKKALLQRMTTMRHRQIDEQWLDEVPLP